MKHIFFTLRHILSWLDQRIRSIFSLDLRALALLRIGLGIVILVDLITNSFSLTAHFTDAGVLPLDVLLPAYSEENMWSLHSISGRYRREVMLFLLNGCVAVGLLVGRKTRWMTVLARVLFCSMSGRNPLIINGGDVLLRMLLFRSMFLPLGALRSRDAKRHGTPSQITFFSRATVGLTVQMISVYVFSFLLKTDPQRTSEFTALYTALSLDAFKTPLGELLYQHPQLMKVLTQAVRYLEGYGFLLLIVPRKTARRRTAGCLLFISFHIGLILTMQLGHFPRTALLGWIALLPTPLWNRLVGSYTPGPTALTQIRKRNIGVSLFLITCLTYICLRNLRTTDFEKREEIFPKTMNKFGFLFRLDQYRSMFAPYPMEDDGRRIIKGTSSTGAEIDIAAPELPVSYDKPSDFSKLYKNEKRRKYFNNLRAKKNQQYRAPYLAYLCRERHQTHPDLPLATISMEYVLEPTAPNYQTTTGETILLKTIVCQK